MFEQKSKKNKARTGIINTLHGGIITPAFFPDATYGAIKSLSFSEAHNAGVREIVTTTLHLEMTVGSEFIGNFGGLHKFLNWNRPILTDSGGFQIFSLIHRKMQKLGRITDAGVTFEDPRTGKFKILTPEISQIIQHNLGSDIRVVLDEPALRTTSIKYLKEANRRTVEWAKRSKEIFLKLNGLTESDFDNPRVKRPLLCAVIQGGNVENLRKENAKALIDIGFDIYGFGGGLPMKDEKSWKNELPKGLDPEMLAFLADLIPQDKIRYGLGMGTPDDLRSSIECGWDIFDTVLPTRNARHGYLYVNAGDGDAHFNNYSVMHIKKEIYKKDIYPINKDSRIKDLREISRAYLRYLFKIGENEALRLATMNNLEFYSQLMEKAGHHH